MNILVILGHPDPDSFNHAIARSVCKTLENSNHEVHLPRSVPGTIRSAPTGRRDRRDWAGAGSDSQPL